MRLYLKVLWPGKIRIIDEVIQMRVYSGLLRPGKVDAMRVYLRVPQLDKVRAINRVI